MRSIALVALIPLLALTARADEERDTVRDTVRYYGWELALVDGAAWLLAVKGAPAIGIALYVAGGPAIHAANGEAERAGISLGVRLGAPLVGGVLADRTAGHGGDDDIPAAFGGVVLGVLAAEIIDDAVLGWKTERHAGIRAAVAPAPGGGVVSLSGRF